MTTEQTPLFILEMANNHMGSVDHGLRIIREMAAVAADFDCRVAVKFQYRDLDSLIHPAYRGRTDFKYVKRFSETRLSASQFLQLREAVRTAGLLAVCTAFDEPSVALVEEHGYDLLKVASCAFTDWPLLERVVQSPLPVIASAAGAALDDVDRVVSFFEHRRRPLTLMHCVGEYPTADVRLELSQIDLFRDRYPAITVGFSTHEQPDNLESVMIAVAKGAMVFEKHVGVPTEQWPLNAYSANPEQTRRWLAAARRALTMCGTRARRADFSPAEVASLRELRRGVYLRRAVARGARIGAEDVQLAIPVLVGQLTANDLSKYTILTATSDLDAQAPVLGTQVTRADIREKVNAITLAVRDMVRESRVVIPGKMDFEISHHYGIERFDEFGATIITCVNREYCKKLIVLLPKQMHPEQYHEQKEETFLILHGAVTIGIDGAERELRSGDIVTIERGQRHWFTTTTGTVIEEISSTHIKSDSFYTDPAISANPNRKTWLTYWLV